MKDNCPETDDEMYAIIDKLKKKKPKVELIGKDGNAFYIIGACQRAWKKSGGSNEEWESIKKEMTGGNYDKLISVAVKNFDVY